jgi:two-component system KDP operon response regulator KdpE
MRRLRTWTGAPVVVVCGRSGDADENRTPDRVRIGYFVVNLAAKSVIPQPRSGDGASGDGNSADIRLTPTEWRLLETLVQSPGRLLSRQQLLSRVWGPGYERATGNLRLYMTQLRRKLEPDPARPRWLITERGMGYRFEP